MAKTYPKRVGGFDASQLPRKKPSGVVNSTEFSSAERINPAEAAKQRRTPLIDVTPVVSAAGYSHIAEPPPRKL